MTSWWFLIKVSSKDIFYTKDMLEFLGNQINTANEKLEDILEYYDYMQIEERLAKANKLKKERKEAKQ